MKKFEFKLEAVKNHRELLKDLANREYQAARFIVDQKLAQIKDMHTAIDEAREKADELQKVKGPTASQLMQIEEFIVGQGLRIQRARQEVRELMLDLEDKHEILVEKVKDFKILEKLEAKQKIEFKKAQNKLEQKKTDDLTIMRFKRGQV